MKASVDDLRQTVSTLAKVVHQQSPRVTPSGHKDTPKSMINHAEQKSSLSGHVVKNNGKNDGEEEVAGRKLFFGPTYGIVDFTPSLIHSMESI